MRVVGGIPVGEDGRIHGTFTHNPSSLRLSMVAPSLHQIPRGHGVDEEADIQKWVKECFVAPAGYTFWSRDFSAIEAVLTGYFAGSANYIRLAKLGIHAYLASHILGRPADLSWSDADLKAYFKQIKEEDITVYDTAKRVVHASNYLVTPVKLCYEYPEFFKTSRDAGRLQNIYFDICPEIREWQLDLCKRVDGTKRRKKEEGEACDPWTLGVCYAQNPFDYIHRFYDVLDWKKIEIEEGESQWIWGFGEDAKRLVSFLPQSTAAAIIKRAGKTLWYRYPAVGQTMRLWVHDNIMGEVREGPLVEECLKVSKMVMEAPIPELPLDPAWGMGEFLSIGSEGEVGKTWATMTTQKA